jgi:chaperonin cofactor prefoldin
MDAGSLALMIPIVAIVAGAMVKMARLRAGTGLGNAADELHRRIDVLEQDHDKLRQELVEAQERLDFTERLLARQKDSSLPPTT